MRLTLKISKTENFFFFVSNMSQWHESCRKQYNLDWEKMATINEEQIKSLGDFRKLIQKYNFEGGNNYSKYLGKYFYLPTDENAKWSKVKNVLTSQEYRKLRSIFISLRPIFENVWDKKILTEWKKDLEKEIITNDFKKLIKDLCFLFPKLKNQSIKIHILASPSTTKTPAGGANIGDRDITLEVPVSKKTKWNIEYALATAIHEIIHLAIEEKSLGNIIDEKIETQSFPRGDFKEALVHTIAPYGYPIEKYFTAYKPKEDILMPSLENGKNLYKEIALDSYTLTKDYLESKKEIDSYYIDKFTKIFSIRNSALYQPLK